MSGAEIQGVVGAGERLRYWVAPETPPDLAAVERTVRLTAEELRRRGEDLGAEILEALILLPRSQLAPVAIGQLLVLERRLPDSKDRRECHAARLAVTHHRGTRWRELRLEGVRLGAVSHNELGWWGNPLNGSGTTLGPRESLAELVTLMMAAGFGIEADRVQVG